jgi:uncharacterized protein
MAPTARSTAPLEAVLGVGLYALILWALWIAAHTFGIAQSLHGHLSGPFCALALMLAVFWAFGWGAGEPLSHWLADNKAGDSPAGDNPAGDNPAGQHGSNRTLRGQAGPIARVLVPGVFAAVVYLLLAVPLGAFSTGPLLVYFALPVLLAVVLEYGSPKSKLGWQDVVVLAGLVLPIAYGWLVAMLPESGLGGLPELLWTDVALYLYVVVRRLPGIGFDLRLRLRDLVTGVREWLLFAPLGVALGLVLGFLRVHRQWPQPGPLAGTALVTLLFVALPEELLFRGLLQNLLETRLQRTAALALAAAIFGLSHYHHGSVFNWRYVLLATIAGCFYGRAWRRDRRLGASAITHALVDVVWGTWLLNLAASGD